MGEIQSGINQLISQVGIMGGIAKHIYIQSPQYKGAQALKQANRLAEASETSKQILQQGVTPEDPQQAILAHKNQAADIASQAQEAKKAYNEALSYGIKPQDVAQGFSQASQNLRYGQTLSMEAAENQRALDAQKQEQQTAAPVPTVTPEQAMAHMQEKGQQQVRQRTNFAKLLEGVKHPYNGQEVPFEELPKEVQKGVVKSLTEADKRELKAQEGKRQEIQGERVSFGGEDIGTVGQLPKRYQQQIAKQLLPKKGEK